MNSPTTPPEGATITTTIAGRVTDESGAAIAGVTVTGQNGSATTDANGLFFIQNTNVSSERTFILAKKAGYFDGARAAIPTVNGVTYMQITLASSTPIGTLDAASGGTLNLAAGGSITLAPGGVVTSSGATYTGSVSVSAEHLDPGNGNFANLFAGDLTGQQTDGTQTELQSYGVIIAELHGSSGETLQPDPSKPATLTMPIATADQATAPASIPLWYFDENLGMWKEQGSAIKQGYDYVGTVAHFSFWNYDMQCPYGTITGTIVCNDVPIPGVVVNLGAYVEGGQPYVLTDGGGRFSVRVAANNNNVMLQVLANENNGVYWTNTPIVENIPANVTTDVGQISLASPCPNYLTGTLENCNHQPTPGMIFATWSGGMTYSYTTDGIIKLIAPSGMPLTLAATAAAGDVAQPQTVTAGAEGTTTSLPAIVACNGQTSDVHLDIPGSFSAAALTFSPDGSKVATMASNGTDVIVLDVNTGSAVSQFTVTTTKLPVASIAFSPDGSKLLTLVSQTQLPRGAPTLGTGSFDCWTVTGTRLTPTSVSANSAVFSKDGLDVFASSNDSNQGKVLGVVDYNLSQTKVIQKFSSPAYYQVLGTAASGTELILWSYETLYLWDIATDKLLSSFQTTIGSYNSTVRTSADGSILGIDNMSVLNFYNTQTASKITTGTINPSYGGSYGIAPDNTTFIGQYQSGGSNTVGLFNITDGSPYHLFDAPASFGNSSGVAISPDGKLAAAIYGTEIRIWNVN